ncbi:hypothetical protein Tco_0617277 [Tanacetum coccineum]
MPVSDNNYQVNMDYQTLKALYGRKESSDDLFPRFGPYDSFPAFIMWICQRRHGSLILVSIHDFICNERIVWVDIEGIPLKFWSPTTFSRIGTKWGIVMDIEETPSSSFARKRLCIKTSLANNILETFKVVFKGEVFLVRAKELFTWTPCFLEFKDPGYNSDDDSVLGVQNSLDKSQQGFDNPVGVSDVEEVSEIVFGDNSHSPSCNEHDVNETANAHSEDPFDIYKLLRKNSNYVDTEVDPSLSHPPSFKSDGPHQVNHQEEFQETSHSENHVDTKVDPSLSHPPGFTPAGTNQVGVKKAILVDLTDIDKSLDLGIISDELLAKRSDLNRILFELNQLDTKDAAQKAKIKKAN